VAPIAVRREDVVAVASGQEKRERETHGVTRA
jgi:hypothetical protein